MRLKVKREILPMLVNVKLKTYSEKDLLRKKLLLFGFEGSKFSSETEPEFYSNNILFTVTIYLDFFLHNLKITPLN